MTIIPKTHSKASAIKHLALGHAWPFSPPNHDPNDPRKRPKNFFSQSCKTSLDKAARRAYIQSVDKRKETHMTNILSDIFDALAAAAFVAGVICLAIALNP